MKKIISGPLVLCLASSASAFSPRHLSRPAGCRRAVPAPRAVSSGDRSCESSRGAFLSSACGAVLSVAALSSPAPARAEGGGDPEARPEWSIRGCERGEDDCVSTANIKDAKGSYSPPWTFEVSPDEAFARIKGVLKSDDAFTVTKTDDQQRYVRAYARRLAADTDEVEFLVRGDDKVVLFRSSARKNGSVSDFGANRKRIDDIRDRGAVFGLMGGGMTADSYGGGGAASRGNNPFGQIKAFYGLQSGEGFQSVFEEEE